MHAISEWARERDYELAADPDLVRISEWYWRPVRGALALGYQTVGEAIVGLELWDHGNPLLEELRDGRDGLSFAPPLRDGRYLVQLPEWTTVARQALALFERARVALGRIRERLGAENEQDYQANLFALTCAERALRQLDEHLQQRRAA